MCLAKDYNTTVLGSHFNYRRLRTAIVFVYGCFMRLWYFPFLPVFPKRRVFPHLVANEE
jgi:hypothetical protein